MPDTASHTINTAPIADTAIAPSLFRNNLLEKHSDKPKLHFTDYDFGVASVLLLAFMLFIWLYSSSRKRLEQVVKGFYLSRFTGQSGRDELSLGNRVVVFLSVLFILTFSLFITQTADHYGYGEGISRTAFFIRTSIFITLAYTVKILAVRFFGFVFQSQKESSDYAMMVFLFCNTLGMFLLPIVICLAFVKDVSPLVFIYSGLGIYALFLCIRLLKGIIIGFNSVRVSKFYLFLYLCTLEILPFIIGIKLFMLNIN